MRIVATIIKLALSLKDEWEKDFQLTTIGTSYCHSRMFAVDQETFEMFKMYNTFERECYHGTSNNYIVM